MLEVENLHAHYGKSHVLNGINLSVGPAEVVSVLGRNGSGRSTMVKAILGLVPPSAGRVRLAGTDLTGQPVHRIVQAGIAYVPEERLVFDNLTVEENLSLGLLRADQPATRWTVAEMFELFPRLKERRSVGAGNLSGGEQQMLTICRSLLCQPRVILIDEPTEGLAPKIVEQVAEVIAEINRRGVAVVLIEQKLTIAFRVANRCCVVGRGEIVFTGAPSEVAASAEIRRRWLEAA